MRGTMAPDVTPAPRPYFDVPGPDHQPPTDQDAVFFLHRTAGQMGHTFTEAGRQ